MLQKADVKKKQLAKQCSFLNECLIIKKKCTVF